MAAKVLYHPRLSGGRAVKMASTKCASVRCADCRHAFYKRYGTTDCWCLYYSAKRSLYSARECGGFEERE